MKRNNGGHRPMHFVLVTESIGSNNYLTLDPAYSDISQYNLKGANKTDN